MVYLIVDDDDYKFEDFQRIFDLSSEVLKKNKLYIIYRDRKDG